MRLFVVMVLLFLSAQARAGLSFQLSVETKNTPGEGASGTPADSTEQSQVVLGERYLSVKSAGRMTILDFDKRRRYEIDLKDASYVDYSLYDAVGFRVMELNNREGLRRALAAAKLERPVSDLIFDEQSLSVMAKPGAVLDEVGDGADTVFSLAGKLLARRGATATEVSPADAAAFTRFLRYQFGGHPLLLAKLASSGRIPAKLVMHYREVGGSQSRSLTISGLTPTAPASYELRPFHPRAATGAADEIDQLLDRAGSAPLPTVEETRQKFDADIALAFSEKRTLDAVLGTSEFFLMTGAPVARFSPENAALAQADPAVGAFSKAVAAKDKASLAAAIPALQALRQQTMRKQHMLKLYEANDQARLGDRGTALRLFASVLRANMGLAGAYKDMGDTLFAGFDMPRAWRSWDAGRRFAPTLGLFTDVSKFEQNLLQQHPEYF